MVKDSLNTYNNDSMNEGLIEVKVEPYDLHDCIGNISRHNKTITNNSELSHNIEKSGNLMTGKLFLNCNNSIILV